MHRDFGLLAECKIIISDTKFIQLKKSLTLLKVGFSLKNRSVSRPFGVLKRGLTKIAPLATASNGAGPSYGKPNPKNICN